MVEPVVQPSDTNTKNAPNAKETPGGNNLNQNLAGRKVDSNVFPNSLVDYNLSQSDGKFSLWWNMGHWTLNYNGTYNFIKDILFVDPKTLGTLMKFYWINENH